MLNDRAARGATLRWILSAFFVIAGTLHFVKTSAYASIVPPSLGHPVFWVCLSGVAEIAGGLAILFAPLRRLAGYGLIVLLIVVYPANIYMAMHAQLFQALAPALVLWLRLPLQIVFIVWVWWCCLRSS
ncbi:MAG: DoxX family membrane protein [Candidatus Eremiobacteraeota bacterium]|nr:DoxX family membrane protein [Candidatus Eremiobacteraeota bacterium]